MTGIVEFLTARLDEDEAAAVRAARPEPWVKPQPSRPDWHVQFWADEQDRAAVIADPESSAYPVVTTLGYDGADEADEDLAEGRVEHIARHDPARVLAEVKAKRELMEIAFDHAAKIDGEWGCCHSAESIKAGRCEDERPEDQAILRTLAKLYDQHPDYNPAWRVDA